jgi:hypothetical protein
VPERARKRVKSRRETVLMMGSRDQVNLNEPVRVPDACANENRP